MIVKTRIFELSHNYKNLSQLAQTMGISVSQIYRVRQGKRNINQKFIVGAIKAFPHHRFDDLFYFAPEMSSITDNRRDDGSAIHAAHEQLTKEEQKKRARQTVGVT